MTWQTTNMEIPYQLFIGREGAIGLINGFKLDLVDPISLDVTSPRGTAPDIRPANQIISLWACSVRRKRRQQQAPHDGVHGASPCAPSILAHWGAIMPSAGTITGSNFTNEVSANVARQSSFSLRGHSHTESTCEQKQGSESLPTSSLSEVLDVCRSVIRPPFMNRKTMKIKNNNPLSVSSIQSCNTNRRTAGRLRSAGFTTVVLSVILGCCSTAALAWLAVIGVNLALISAAVLLIYIIFGSIVSRSVTNCHRIQ